MRFQITLSHEDIHKAVMAYVQREFGLEGTPGEVSIWAKSKQNFRPDKYELVEFSAEYEVQSK